MFITSKIRIVNVLVIVKFQTVLNTLCVGKLMVQLLNKFHSSLSYVSFVIFNKPETEKILTANILRYNTSSSCIRFHYLHTSSGH
jgi:hypothetical protein